MKQRLITFTAVAVLFLFVLSGCGLLGGDDGDPTSTETVSLNPDTGAEQPAVGTDPAQPETAEPDAPAPDAPAVDPESPTANSSQEQALTQALPAAVYVSPPANTAVSAGTTVTHRVMEGEWMLQIARCYGTSYTAVRNANPTIYNPNMIYPGTSIVVPNAGSLGPISPPPCVVKYTVAAGDTWESIAAAHNTTAAILRNANPVALTVGGIIYVPNNQTGTSQPVSLTHDLIFHYDGNLAIWQAIDGRVAIFPTEATVLDIATNASGDYVLARQTIDGSTTEIVLIDLVNNAYTIVESGLPADDWDDTRLRREILLVSPDGQHAAYLLPDGNGYRLTTFATGDPNTLNTLGGINHGGNEYILPQLFGDYDNNNLLLLDGGGIFAYDYALVNGEQVVATIEDADPVAGYEAVAWSPTASHLLLRQFYLEGSSYSVLDRTTGQVVDVPDSAGYVSTAAVSWQNDGTVLVFTPPYDETSDPTTATFQPQIVDGNTVLAEQSKQPMTAAPRGYWFVAPSVQTQSPRLVVGMEAMEADASGIYTLENTTAAATQQLKTVSLFGATQWVPDTSGVLIDYYPSAGVEGDVLYIAADGSTTFSLLNWLGLKIADFHWASVD